MIDVRKNSAEVIRIAAGTYKDQRYYDVRIWVVGDGDELIPTKKGVRFREDLLPELIRGLESVRRGKGSGRERA